MKLTLDSMHPYHGIVKRRHKGARGDCADLDVFAHGQSMDEFMDASC